MNVTTIGFPFAAPVSQGGAADGTIVAGFADMVGSPAGNGVPFGQLGTAALTAQLGTPILTAQTGAPLLPAPGDAATTTLPGDRPAVPMAQLLATSAPQAGSAPTMAVAGGNPLADAVAKALAKPGSAPQGAATPGDTASAATAADLAAPPPPAVAAPPQGAGDPGQPAAAASKAAKTTVAAPAAPQPGDEATIAPPADDAIPAEPALAAPVEAKGLRQPGKNAAGSGSDTDAEKELRAPADAAAAASAAAQPLLAIVAQVPAPAAAQPAPAPAKLPGKAVGASAARIAKTDIAATPDAPARPTLAGKADPAAGAAAAAEANRGDANTQGGSGQHGFAQQLATADGPHPAASALPNGAAPLAAPAPAAAHAASSTAATPAMPGGEPVLNARPGELGRSLGVEIARKVDAGEDMLRVRLNPAELGRVEVTLAFDRDGRVQATMRAESQHTLDLLRQDAPDLGRALDQAGIRTDAQSFRFESRDGSGGNGGSGQPGFQQQSRGGNQQFRDEPDPRAPAYRAVRGDGQVDLIA